MTFERLEALYEGGAHVHYQGELFEIVGINQLKQTAQIARVGGMFEPAKEVSASELD